jgi:hypothetical protein
MKRMMISVLLLAWTVALAVMSGPAFLSTNSAVAQAAKARQQWEYASLVIGDAAGDVDWQTGKTTRRSPGDVTKPDPSRGVNELYRQLGGKEQSPTLGVLLNQIGQDGWEMVSYTRPPGVQTWMFKRVGQ